MSKAAVTALATDAALVLAAHHLGTPTLLSDARVFACGHLGLWASWPTLPEPAKVRIARSCDSAPTRWPKIGRSSVQPRT